MASVVGTLVGSKDFYMDCMVSATFVAGQVVVREATASNVGELASPASTTTCADGVGVLTDAVTSATTPNQEFNAVVPVSSTLENVARVMCSPFQIMRFRIAGGATTGTALAPASATPANVLLNDSADASAPYATITETAVGTIDMSGGLVKGRTGNNVGAIRKLISQSNNTSCTVGIGFYYALAANDTFIRVPYSRTCQNLQWTSNYVEVNGVIATGTGAPMRVVNVIIDEINDVAYVDAVFADSMWNVGD